LDYTFQEGLPAGFKSEIDSGIFHHPQHLQLQTHEGWHTYVLLNTVQKSIQGLVHFNLTETEARSPYRSPYGSFIFADRLSAKIITEFVLFTEQKLKTAGANTITIKNFPEVYAPEKHNMLLGPLLQSGYTIAQEEVSAVIPVTEKSFEAILHQSEKKKLRKSRKSNLTFEQLPLQHLADVYTFLKTCREEKGYTLSMTLNELDAVIKAFPDYFFLNVVKKSDQIIAANISIQVNSTVLYNFYHDHARAHDALSPVVFLNEGLYQFCQRHPLRLLDLGTSNANGVVNESLLNFKLRLGAQPSRKLTFVKKL
jgi:hypothetical protein